MWFAGYRTDCEVIRKTWLASLDCTKRAMLGGASDRDGIYDALAPVSELFGKKCSLETGAPYEDTQALASGVLNAFVASVANSDNPAELVGAANALLNSNSSASRWGCSISGEELRAVLEFIAAEISLDSQARLISTATDTDLDEAHRRWRDVRRVISSIASEKCQGNHSEDLTRILSVLFGGECILFLIWLEKRGMGSLIDAKLLEAENYVRENRWPGSVVLAESTAIGAKEV
jgi:hypothetical protein